MLSPILFMSKSNVFDKSTYLTHDNTRLNETSHVLPASLSTIILQDVLYLHYLTLSARLDERRLLISQIYVLRNINTSNPSLQNSRPLSPLSRIPITYLPSLFFHSLLSSDPSLHLRHDCYKIENDNPPYQPPKRPKTSSPKGATALLNQSFYSRDHAGFISWRVCLVSIFIPIFFSLKKTNQAAPFPPHDSPHHKKGIKKIKNKK